MTSLRSGTKSNWTDTILKCAQRSYVGILLFVFFFFNIIVNYGEGNGTPLQYSCLENPMGGGAWWAAVHGVAKSRTHWATSLSLFTFMHWRRKWQPTPVFLLENPRDGGAWWAAVYVVAQSLTPLKWLSSSSSIINNVVLVYSRVTQLYIYMYHFSNSFSI